MRTCRWGPTCRAPAASSSDREQRPDRDDRDRCNREPRQDPHEPIHAGTPRPVHALPVAVGLRASHEASLRPRHRKMVAAATNGRTDRQSASRTASRSAQRPARSRAARTASIVSAGVSPGIATMSRPTEHTAVSASNRSAPWLSLPATPLPNATSRIIMWGLRCSQRPRPRPASRPVAPSFQRSFL